MFQVQLQDLPVFGNLNTPLCSVPVPELTLSARLAQQRALGLRLPREIELCLLVCKTSFSWCPLKPDSQSTAGRWYFAWLLFHLASHNLSTTWTLFQGFSHPRSFDLESANVPFSISGGTPAFPKPCGGTRAYFNSFEYNCSSVGKVFKLLCSSESDTVQHHTSVLWLGLL